MRKKARLRQTTDSAIEKEEETQIVYELSDEEKNRDLLDQQERDAFAQRLLNKDQNLAKRKMEKSTFATEESIMLEAEDARRKALVEEAESRDVALRQLRELSRQSYLGKREEQQVLLLEKALQDEERLFAVEDLTPLEKHDLAMKRKLLDLVKEKQKLKYLEKGPRYLMPDQISDEKVTEPPEDEHFTRQDEWEANQLSTALKNLRTIKNKQGLIQDQELKDSFGEYEFLLDENQIEFIMQNTLSGLDVPQEKTITPSMKKAFIKMTLEEARKSLPVYSYKEELLAAIDSFPVLIVVGETGSGKTTQIPQYFVESGYTKPLQMQSPTLSDSKDDSVLPPRMIACTQPRRVAAMSVAARVAQEAGVVLGHEVGYSIRFEDCTSNRTQLKYMTDGMLIREFLMDPLLSRYSVIMIDEAHERTVATDVLFGLLKDLLRVRHSDLKLIISSATLDAQSFSSYFDDAPMFHIPGRRFPVDIYYTKTPEADYVNAIVLTVFQIHLSQPLDGDVLVFLTGQEDIEDTMERLNVIARALGSRIPELIITPIYASLPSEQQAKIFVATPKGARKVVLATNIAETSITIDGIVYVIDPGLVKQKSYQPKTGLESLIVVPCSQAAANQRAGRAGRTQPGKCFRLYTKWSFDNEMDANTLPEMQRTDLSNIVLLLKSLGIDDLLHFEFMDPPSPDTLIQSLELLYALGALNQKGQLTKTGRRMAELPLSPMLSKTMLASETFSCSSEILTIAAMLSLNHTLFYRPPVKEQRIIADNLHKGFNYTALPGGDPLIVLNVYESWVENNYSQQWCYEHYIHYKALIRARAIRDQLEALLVRVEVPLQSIREMSLSTRAKADSSLSGMLDPSVPIRKALLSGYFYNVARLSRSGDISYRNLRSGQSMYIHPSSSLFHTTLSRSSDASISAPVLPPTNLCYNELVLTNKEYMRNVFEIKPEWLKEVAPHLYKNKKFE